MSTEEVDSDRPVTEWEMRRLLDHEQLHAIARRTAECIPGATVSPRAEEPKEEPGEVTIQLEGEPWKVRVCREYQHKKRVVLRAVDDLREYLSHHEREELKLGPTSITVDGEREPKAIAGEILRRLVPNARAEYAARLKNKQRTEDYAAKTSRNAARLVAAVTGASYRHQRSQDGTMIDVYLPTWPGLVRVQGDSVTPHHVSTLDIEAAVVLFAQVPARST